LIEEREVTRAFCPHPMKKNHNVLVRTADLVGPSAIGDAAVRYACCPETLSHSVRDILGYSFREFQSDSKSPDSVDPGAFAVFVVEQWKNSKIHFGATA